jgi:hypothetical protein
MLFQILELTRMLSMLVLLLEMLKKNLDKQ